MRWRRARPRIRGCRIFPSRSRCRGRRRIWPQLPVPEPPARTSRSFPLSTRPRVHGGQTFERLTNFPALVGEFRSIAACPDFGAVRVRQAIEPNGKGQYIERHGPLFHLRSESELLHAFARLREVIEQARFRAVRRRCRHLEQHTAGMHYRTGIDVQTLPVYPTENISGTIAKNLSHRFGCPTSVVWAPGGLPSLIRRRSCFLDAPERAWALSGFARGSGTTPPSSLLPGVVALNVSHAAALLTPLRPCS